MASLGESPATQPASSITHAAAAGASALLHSSCLPGQTAAPACLRSAPGTDAMPPRRPPLAVLAAGVLAAFPCGGGVPSTGGAIGAGAPSFLPPDGGPWTLFEPWSDEFSGAALNATKWWPTMDDGFAGSAPGLNVAQNAVVSGGQLHLFARAVSGRLPGSPPGYANVTTAAVGTRTMRRFGYFEIRARLMNSSGIKSAFWFNQGPRAPFNAPPPSDSGTTRLMCLKWWLVRPTVASSRVTERF